MSEASNKTVARSLPVGRGGSSDALDLAALEMPSREDPSRVEGLPKSHLLNRSIRAIRSLLMTHEEREDVDRESRIRALHAQLRQQQAILDSEFDGVYPPDVRAVSSSFWTPVSVAVRAAELLVSGKADRVLDVGSGVGKFCIVGAASTGAAFVGVEQRAHLVRVAEDARRRIAVHSAQFIRGSFDAIDVADFDAIYFFNPFEENLWESDTHLDQTVELSKERYFADVASAENMLRRARVGTRVVTYHGFGGQMPPGYDLVLREPQHTDKLELWKKSKMLPGRPSVDLVRA